MPPALGGFEPTSPSVVRTGTAVAVDLDDGRCLPFPRQVGLRADDVRLAALTVGIPTT